MPYEYERLSLHCSLGADHVHIMCVLIFREALLYSLSFKAQIVESKKASFLFELCCVRCFLLIACFDCDKEILFFSFPSASRLVCRSVDSFHVSLISTQNWRVNERTAVLDDITSWCVCVCASEHKRCIHVHAVIVLFCLTMIVLLKHR